MLGKRHCSRCIMHANVMYACNLSWIAGISYTIASCVSYLSLSPFCGPSIFFPFTCSVTVHFSMLMVATSCKKKIHHFQGNLVWRTRHKQISKFYSQAFWLLWKLLMEDRVLWRWGNILLSQLPFLPWGLCSVCLHDSPSAWLTSWRAWKGCLCVHE